MVCSDMHTGPRGALARLQAPLAVSEREGLGPLDPQVPPVRGMPGTVLRVGKRSAVAAPL